MDLLSHFILLLLLVPSFLFFKDVSGTSSSDEFDDLMIRQAVSHEDDFLNAEHQFARFKANYGKTYATQEEHDRRFNVFKANLRRAKRHQQLDPTAVHGVTQFSDLTPAEFRRDYLGLKSLRLPADAQKAPILPTDNLPTDFDWRKLGAVTPVKNQVRNFNPFITYPLLMIFFGISIYFTLNHKICYIFYKFVLTRTWTIFLPIPLNKCNFCFSCLFF